MGTLHDERHYIEPGDWVITEPNGENHYPCKDEVFRERYEPVEVEDPVDALMRELAALPKGDRACAVSLFGRKHGSGDHGQSRGAVAQDWWTPGDFPKIPPGGPHVPRIKAQTAVVQ